MRIEWVPGQANVVRFPVERRASPTLDLLRGIAPDVREVMCLAESFGLPRPDPQARHEEDLGTADFIANHVVPEPGAMRRRALDELLADAVNTAIAACRAAHDASVVADEARQRLIDAQSEGGYWLQPLEQRADARTTEAAVLMIEAHEASERVEGAARAIGFARRGEAWKPFDLNAEAAALFGLTG